MGRQRHWWVSHKSTGHLEVEGGYLWSPKESKGGVFSQYYENMTEVRAGDSIVSFRMGQIRHAGVILGRAYTAEKPEEFGAAGEVWANQGWKVEVAWAALPRPLTPRGHIERLRGLLPEKYSPLSHKTGKGNQAYLFEIRESLYQLVFELMEAAPGSVHSHREFV